MSALDIGQTIRIWWQYNIADRDSSAARGLSARLRRAGAIEALAEPQVYGLSRDIGLTDATRLVRLVLVLAELRVSSTDTLAKRLGQGDPPALSRQRFQKLIRADGDILVTSLRRALPMVARTCNVAELGRDMFWWDDKTRARWCFQYYGAAAPLSLSDKPRPEEIIP